MNLLWLKHIRKWELQQFEQVLLQLLKTVVNNLKNNLKHLFQQLNYARYESFLEYYMSFTVNF